MRREHDEFSPPPEEFLPPGEEFPAPGPEFAPLPEEFPTPGGKSAEPERPARRRRWLRKALYLAAGAALAVLLARPVAPAPAEPTPVAVEPIPTPVAAATPAPTPEATPVPVAEEEPRCDILFFAFSSEHHARLRFTRPEAFLEARIVLWEPILELPVAEYALTPEEMAAGEVTLPVLDTGAVWWEHYEEYQAADAWPESLVLQASLRYWSDGAEVTEERTVTADQELGWGVRFWAEDTEASPWTLPGGFTVTTYESAEPVTLVWDDPEAVGPGVISVSLSIDGRPVSEAEARLDQWEERYGDTVWYYARFGLLRPDWAAESGTLRVTVVQLLEHSGELWVTERDYPYTPAGIGE